MDNITELTYVPIQLLMILAVNFFLLEYKISKEDFPILSILIVVPTGLLFIFFGPIASFYLLFSIILFFKFKQVNKHFFLHVVFSFMLAVLIDHFTSIISANVLSNWSSNLSFYLFRNALFCILFVLSSYLYKQIFNFIIKLVTFHKKLTNLISLILFFTLLFFYFNIMLMPDHTSYEAIQLNLWIFSIYFVLIFIIAAAIIYLSLKQYKIRAKEEEQENFSNYLQLLEQSTEDTRKFRHDYINILMSLRYYIEKEDLQALKSYFYDTILPTQQKEIDNTNTLNELNKLKINGLKGLLTTKFIHAQENSIPIHLEVSEKISHIQLNIIELNRILGILLDNAIEASKELKNPLIRVAFIKLEQSIMIVILNKTQEDLQLTVQDVFFKGFSTKGENRGLGLSILKEITNMNNHIVLNTKIDAHYFIQELEIQQEEK